MNRNEKSRSVWFRHRLWEPVFVVFVTVMVSFVMTGCDVVGPGAAVTSTIPGTYTNSALSSTLTFKSDNTYSGSSVSAWRQSGRWQILSNGHLSLEMDSFETWNGSAWVAGDASTVETSFRVTDSGIFVSILNQPYPDGAGGQENVTVMVASRRPEGSGSGLTGTWDCYAGMGSAGNYQEEVGIMTPNEGTHMISYTWTTDEGGTVSAGPFAYQIAGNLLTIDPSGQNIQEKFFKIDDDHFVVAFVESTQNPPTAPTTVDSIADVMYVRQ